MEDNPVRKEFLASSCSDAQAHLDVTWAADFFTEEVWTCSGLVTYYALFFIHPGTRRVYVAGCTPHPDTRWMQQQARNFARVIAANTGRVAYLIHDRDGAVLPLDGVLRTEGVEVIKTPPAVTDVQRVCRALRPRDSGDVGQSDSARRAAFSRRTQAD